MQRIEFECEIPSRLNSFPFNSRAAVELNMSSQQEQQESKKGNAKLPGLGDFQVEKTTASSDVSERKYTYFDLVSRREPLISWELASLCADFRPQFRYSTCAERFLLVFSMIVATIASAFIPYFILIYGEFTSLLIDRTVGEGTSSPAYFLALFGGGQRL